MISGFQSSPQHAALSILISYRLLTSRPGARLYVDRKSLFTLSNSFDHRSVLIWPFAASGGARISSRGEPKFFSQHSPDAMEKPSGSSHNRDIEVFSPGGEGCVVFKPNVKKFNVIAHIKKFCP